ncbi:multidrug ABC transporter ATP-binding protein [Nonlabens arenilitoris]|uniref:Multidrug ABC transporter ATP-binding protein n=1 Tax=Nonlabens arenilitoris TaxID=1217969 RepID=A0A2S7U8N4_9FLAO|nr:ABC transporter permease [Nonlabens arenilitoris]PQJ31298.1 multidrug ABC transporter ATP-binding protein [Nonlabens arenilitoris]
MFSRDRWNEILEALNANKLRTFLTAFGVFWGIFILVALLALTNGLRTGVTTGFANGATNSMFMWGQSTSMAYKGLNKGRPVQFKLEDVEALKQNIPALQYVSPRLQLGGFRGANNVTRNEKTGAFGIYGDYPEYIHQEYMDIIKGRWLNYSDINAKMKTAVIGTDVVKSLYDIGEEPIGTYIKINGVNFKVVGVFQNPNTQGDSEEEANNIFIPFTSFANAFNTGNNVGWMAITAYDHTSITTLKPQILSIMREQRGVHPDDQRAIGNFDKAEIFARFTGLFDILGFVGYFVGALVLLSGGIGISNIMLIVVKERTNEIGVRRALGASPWDIKAQILQESLVLTIVSGLAGIAAAAGLIWVMNYILDQSGPVENFANPSVNITVIIIALIILIIAGLLAGFIPASRATQMKPVDALRTD